MGSYGSGWIVIINGTSSAGKTTLARALQNCSDRPVLRFGIDDFFAMCPLQWSGGSDDSVRLPGGFVYTRSADGGTKIAVGEIAIQLVRSYHAAILAMVESGTAVTVDYLSLDESLALHLVETLRGVRNIWVKVVTPRHILEDREIRRDQVRGLSQGHATSVHDGIEYDLVVDGRGDAVDNARLVLQRVASGRPGDSYSKISR